MREHRRDACCGNPSIPSASKRKCKGEALLYDVAAGLEASGLSAQVICSFAWQGVRRDATVILRRVEASLIDGPNIALVAISRLMRVRDSVQRLEYPIAIRPRSHGPYALYGARWSYAAQRLPRAHRWASAGRISLHFDRNHACFRARSRERKRDDGGILEIGPPQGQLVVGVTAHERANEFRISRVGEIRGQL